MRTEKACLAGKPVAVIGRQLDTARLIFTSSRQWTEGRLALRVGDLLLSPMQSGVPWLELAAQVCQSAREEERHAR